MADLPLGIRNNNPGNLRRGYGLPLAVPVENGFAVFPSMCVGVRSMGQLLLDYYRLHQRWTVAAILSLYAPASENDLLQYEKLMCAGLGIAVPCASTFDIQLDRQWHMVPWINAMSIVECGHPETGWPAYPYWITPRDMIEGLSMVRGWR